MRQIMSRRYSNCALLRAAARHAWWIIRDSVLVRLSETMPHRVQAVIDADGWYTKY